jgi:hypothetical protein
MAVWISRGFVAALAGKRSEHFHALRQSTTGASIRSWSGTGV